MNLVFKCETLSIRNQVSKHSVVYIDGSLKLYVFTLNEFMRKIYFVFFFIIIDMEVRVYVYMCVYTWKDNTTGNSLGRIKLH